MNKKNSLFIVFFVLLLLVVGIGLAVNMGKLNTLPQEFLQKVLPQASLPKINESEFVNISDPLIRKHLAAQYSKPSFRVVTISDGLGANSETIVEFQYISNTDFRMHMTQMLDGKPGQETITTGNTTYMKDLKDDIWWKQTNKPESPEIKLGIDAETFSRENLIKDVMEKTTVTYTKIAEEPCGNLQCYKYEEKNSEEVGTRVFWFDTKNLLLQKEVHGYGEFLSQSLYSYDAVNIQEPSPVKDVPADKSIYEMMVSNYLESSGVGSENETAPIETSQKETPSQEEIENAKKLLESMGVEIPAFDTPVDDSINESGE